MAPRAAAIVAAAAAAAVVAVALLRRRRRKKALPPGLTLFERVLDAGACDALARVVEDLAARGARGELGPRCYTPVSSPSFAERRQSRVMLQFGAYANANRVERRDRALPLELRRGRGERLVDAGVFAAAEAPDACCVNLYEAGQWIPDHVDNGKFARPFATAVASSAGHGLPARRGGGLSAATRKPSTRQRRDGVAARAEEGGAQGEEARAEADARGAGAGAAREPRSAPLAVGAGRRRDAAVEVEHVWKVYDAIAPQWHGTRYKAWPRVAAFCEARCGLGSLVADVGCGNGKNAPALTANGAHVVACDISLALVEIAKREHAGRRYDAAVGDCTRVRCGSGCCDAAKHRGHAPPVDGRARHRAVAETLRVLRPGGTALFYAWAREQREFEARSRAAQESEIPNFKGSDLGHFPLVSADFWTSDHLSERSRSVDVFSVTSARGNSR
ncbi:tRNA (uracil) methyltransferase [Aureococcus anophagefferens]|uniref:tRNA (Uracil) methyltransferase n=1 Tax=Aureococcus anophagefferens TaxID=44056 RepID=A0ABR1G9D9_AURAN